MEKESQELDFCLLIPCYNNKEGLLRSLSSVSYHKDRFLIVIVDDGSSEELKMEELEKAFQGKLPLVGIRIDKNNGITNALNTGLVWIDKHQQTKYIARLDCGDICDPERFYLQVACMNANQEAGLSGSWCLFEEKGHKSGYKYTTPVEHKKIGRAMYFRNVFIHPTVMFKQEIIKRIGNYPTEFELAEDYALFWKISEISKIFVINRFLVTCEINKGGLSYKNKSKQLVARQRVVTHFGKNMFLKIIGIIRLKLLLILPKQLLLLLKLLRG